MAPSSKDDGLVQSLSRGLHILSWLAESENGLSLAEIATRLGVSRPTAFNLAATLAVHGYVTKTSRPIYYRLGPAVGLLYEQQRKGQWRQWVEEELCSLARKIPDCFLFFCENIGGDIRVALRLDPQFPGVIERASTRPITPYVMAISLAYLAFCAEDDRREYMRVYPFAEHGAGRWKDEDALKEELERARRNEALELEGNGIWRYAVPLRRSREHFSGLLCVSRHAVPGEDTAALLLGLRELVQAAGQRINERETETQEGGR